MAKSKPSARKIPAGVLCPKRHPDHREPARENGAPAALPRNPLAGGGTRRYRAAIDGRAIFSGCRRSSIGRARDL